LIFALRGKDLGRILITGEPIRNPPGEECSFLSLVFEVGSRLSPESVGFRMPTLVGSVAIRNGSEAIPRMNTDEHCGGQGLSRRLDLIFALRGKDLGRILITGEPIRSGLGAGRDIRSGAGTNSSGRSSGILLVAGPGADRADFYFLLGIPSRTG
jgi:hypothetical protein